MRQLCASNDHTRVPEQGPRHGTLSLRRLLPRRLLATIPMSLLTQIAVIESGAMSAGVTCHARTDAQPGGEAYLTQSLL